MTKSSQENLNLFDKLWTDVRTFLDEEKVGDSDHLKEQLLTIKKDIQALVKIAIMKNVEQSDMQEITISTPQMSRIEFHGNRYNNILNARKKTPAELEKLFISRATQGQIKTTTKELENIISKKIQEEEFRNEILGMKTYHDVLSFLETRCIKIEDKILSFEQVTKKIDFNRIAMLLYILGVSMGHKLKVFGNDAEVYIYDRQLDKTIICSNSIGYRTYIANGEKDMYDLWELSSADVEKEFSIVSFQTPKQREDEIKKILLGKEIVELPTEEITQQNPTIVQPEIDASHQSSIPEGSTDKSTQDDLWWEKKDKVSEQEKNLTKAEFTKLYPVGEKVKYPEFVLHMKNLGVELPAKRSSLNARFGKTAYIFSTEYTFAILRDDTKEIGRIEEEMRDRRYESSKRDENQKLRQRLKVYFDLPTEAEQKKFIEEHPDLFKNSHIKALNLWGLPIAQRGYLESLINGNPFQRFLDFESKFVCQDKYMGKYSKEVSDVIAEYKKQWGKDFPQYARQMIWKGNGGNGNGIGENGKPNGFSDDEKQDFDRKEWTTLPQEEVIALAEEIFPRDKSWRLMLSEERYKQYLMAHPKEQTLLPKHIYGLLNSFRKFDPYAHQAVASLEYLQALLALDLNAASKARFAYMEKKIRESQTEKVQSMLMCIWRYLEKHGDHSGCERTRLAKPDVVEKLMAKNPHVQKRILNNQRAITSYCIVDKTTNFNNITFDSLKKILSLKIKEIQKLSPWIYNQQYKV